MIAAKPKKKKLKLTQLERDTATQSRLAIDTVTVESYGDLMKDGAKFEAIVVFFDGKRYWVADGWHRCAAAQWASLKSLDCMVYEGTREDAIVYACTANSQHGKAMSNADKRKCVETMLKLRPDWSARAIATHVGVGNALVSRMRREVCPGHTPEVCPGHTPDGPSTDEQFESQLEEELFGEDPNHPAEDDGVDHEGYQEPEYVEEAPIPEADADASIELLAAPYQEAQRYLSLASSLMKKQAEDPISGAYIRDKVTRITTDVQGVRGSIRHAEPVQFCEPCQGQGCKKCRNTGFLTRGIVRTEAKA